MALKQFVPLFSFWKQLLLWLLVIEIGYAGRADREGIDERLQAALLELGFPNGTLPALVPALGNYVDVVEVGKLLFLSSAAPQTPLGAFMKGCVPNEVNATQAVIAAKLACVRQVNRLRTHLGDLDRVKRIAFVKGKIWTQPGFSGHTAIVDGCSAFLVYVFGEEVGKHARTSDGLVSLPFNVTMEVEMIVERK